MSAKESLIGTMVVYGINEEQARIQVQAAIKEALEDAFNPGECQTCPMCDCPGMN